jgi:hypothetical protein
MEKENIGAAERVIQTVLAYTDHMVHNRPGIVQRDPAAVTGVRWTFVKHKDIDGRGKVVFALDKGGKGGKKNVPREIGTLTATNQVRAPSGHILGDYRGAGLYPEVATWLYRQVAEVWKLDNELAARWASYALAQEHRDLKTVLAAFMLVQSRKGDPVREGAKIAFHDDDFRSVGEAMVLAYRKDGKDMTPKLLLRIHEVLSLPGVAAINRELGFGRSQRRPEYGRWEKAVTKWLRHREENAKLLDGLVKAGYRTTVISLVKRARYKPESATFFKALRWEQTQAPDGRRQIAIGDAVDAAASWEGLTEEAICAAIVREKPSYKVLCARVPSTIGVTRAIMAAAIEAGALSDKDLVIATPTLEELGLLQVQDVRERWQRAIAKAEDMRGANIVRRVKTKETEDALRDAADAALKRAVEDVVKGLFIYFMVDVSSSMGDAITTAKRYVARCLQGFPPDKVKVAIFNTVGREIGIKHPSAAGVENAFRGIVAGGGTDYGAPLRPTCLGQYKPAAGEDALFIYVGDEGHNGTGGGHGGAGVHFAAAVRQSGLDPVAIALIPVVSPQYGRAAAVRTTATELGIAYFEISEGTFEDPYAIPRTIRALIAAAPVRPAAATARVGIVETILKTDLLKKPAWAS